jgi:two-component system, OmpR family, sensor kinase
MDSSQPAIPRQETESGIIERLLPRDLRGRFLAVLFGVLLPSLSLFGVLHYDSVKRSLLKEVDQTLVNRAREVEQILSDSGVHTVHHFQDFKMVDSALMVTSAPEVYVDIIDNRGYSLWASQNLVGKSIPLTKGSLGGEAVLETLVQPDGLRLRRYTKPLVLRDNTRIFLVLAEALTHLETALQGSIGRTIILGIVILTLTEILGTLAFRGIFIPLRNLVDTAETIASTDDVTRRVPISVDADKEITRTALAFNALMDRVEHLLEIAKQLLADTSHELRNPLTVLMTDLDLLREELTKEQKDEVISEAQSTVRRLNRLVSDLLLLSRTEAQSEAISLEEVDVTRLVERLADRFSRSLGDDGEIVFDASKSSPNAIALLNRERTEQILTNLFENGVRYSEKSEVKVRVLEEGRNLVISVKDEGCGITPDEQKRVFDRFYRVDRSRNRHSGGTGLGLSVARALARLMGGDIKLVSELGKGSDFRVQFPKVEEA